MPDRDVSQNPDDYPCHSAVQVRFKDLDAMGHVNNAVYFTYFELGREAYMAAVDCPEFGFGAIFDRFPFILAEIHCQYRRPIMMDDAATIHIRVERFGTKSWGFDYLLTRDADGAPLATGRSTQVFFDYRDRTTQPVPRGFIEAVERYEGRALRDA